MLDKLKQQLKSRGASTIRGLGRAFRLMDSYDGNRKVDMQEFQSGLQDMGMQLSKQEYLVRINDKNTKELFKTFDTDGDNHINFDEFLVGIRVSSRK